LDQSVGGKFPLLHFFIGQVGISALIGILLILISVLHAYSFILGVLAFVIPNMYFVYYAFRFQGAEQAYLIERSFKKGQTGKFSISALIFALIFKMVSPLHAEMVFAGFSSMICLHWFLSYMMLKKQY